MRGAPSKRGHKEEYVRDASCDAGVHNDMRGASGECGGCTKSMQGASVKAGDARSMRGVP